MVEGLVGAGSEATATFPFSDIASGSSITLLYGGMAGNPVTRILSKEKFYSSPYTTSASNTGTALQVMFDHDYDGYVSKQITIEGIMTCAIPLSLDSSATDTLRTYVIVRVRKWDGATETEVANATSNTLTNLGAAAETFVMPAATVTIPRTIIRRGTYLRISLEVWMGWDSGSSGAAMKIAHDPYGRTVGWDTTGAVPSTLVFPVPVRVIL